MALRHSPLGSAGPAGPAGLAGLARFAAAEFAAAIGALVILSLLAAPSVAQDDEFSEIETIDMSPDEPASFGARRIGVGLASLFRGSDYYYKEHSVWVETTPAGAVLDLFYLRSNFQRRFEQAESPVRVLLPPRAEASKQDSLTIRAFADGYRLRTVTLSSNTTQERVVIDLDPLPNTLELLSHRYFAGRTSLTFPTKEPLTFRLQEAADGMSVILTETAKSREAAAALSSARSPIVEEMSGQQLGEDLLVQITYGARAMEQEVEVRSRESYDAARELHGFTLDLLLRNGRAEAVAKAHAALSRLGEPDVTGCTLEFDSELRSRLDPAALARALTPRGSFADPYLRAAMRRLGELSPTGVVSFAGGAKFDPAVPIELDAALSQAAGAVGYLALLRRFVVEFEPEEYRRETLRSLVAPELSLERFGEVVDAAVKSELACQASR